MRPVRMLLLLFSAALLSALPVVSAQTELIPPRVIETSPFSGINIGLDEPLALTFDQPMNTELTANAFTISPPVQGQVAFPNPQTLQFTPSEGWERGVTYTAVVNATAQSADGAPLIEPFRFVFDAVGVLSITTVSPEPNSAADVDSDIVVAFDRPVVPLGSTADLADLPNPLRFDPPIEGTGEWVNTSLYVFTPRGLLEGSTTYQATIDRGLTAIDGALLETAFQWTFQTPKPEILSVSPANLSTGVALDAAIVIRFNQPMDTASTEASFDLRTGGQSVPGSFSWDAEQTVMTFTPDERLNLETTYNVLMQNDALSANGQGKLSIGLEGQFTTVPYPAVVSTNPQNGASVDSYYGVTPRITFNTPIDRESLRGRVFIEPEPDNWVPAIYDYAPTQLYIQMNSTPNTTYTITILAGVQDIYGNPTRRDTVFTFTMLPPEPEAYPIIVGNFNVTSSYNERTSFNMLVTGESTVDFSLYRLDTADIRDITFANFDSDLIYASEDTYAFEGFPPWMDESGRGLIRWWSQTFTPEEAGRQIFPVNLENESGEKLEPGLYWVYVGLPSAPRNLPGTYTMQFALAVANTNLTVVRSTDEVLIWATDMQTAQPVPNATITIYREGKVVEVGTTDETGLYRASLNLLEDGLPTRFFGMRTEDVPKTRILITAESETAFGAYYSNEEASIPVERGYLYTDRPVYRPGETVYFRGILRNRRDMDYRVPDIEQVSVTIRRNYEDTVYYSEMLDVTPFGTYSGEFVVPADAPTGEMIIVADFGDGESFQYGGIYPMWNMEGTSSVLFNVAEFRVPEFSVSVTPQVDSLIQGEPFNALVEATLYAGGAVGSANVQYYVYGDPTFFQYAGSERFNFSDDTVTDRRSFYRAALVGTDSYTPNSGTTNDNGQFLITADSTIAPSRVPMQITVEASVSDQSGQAITGRATAIAHPANIYVGLRANSYFAPLGQETAVELIAVTPESVPVANTEIRLQIYEIDWVRVPNQFVFGAFNWERRLTQLSQASVTTDERGRAVYSFMPEKSGMFAIRASAEDDRGLMNSASLNLFVPGEDAVFRSNTYDSVSIIPDEDTYRPGDTASLLIANPFDSSLPVTALLTIERADIMLTDVIVFDGLSVLYDLPILDGYAPNIFVSVVAVSGIGGETIYPAYAMGSVRLDVTPVSRLLTIEVEPSANSAQPRESVSFDLRVTDAEGSPVEAEIGVALTDEAVLALMPRNSATLQDMFYGTQADRVRTSVALSAFIDPLTDTYFPGGRGGGGGGGDEGVLIREDFEYTPLWAPHVVTDENGQATVSVTLPDNLTTWRLDARAVTLRTAVGESTAQIVSTLPLFVRPVAPRFFVVGDQVELATVIQNNTDSEQQIEARLDASGVTLLSDAAQMVSIPAGGSARAAWIVSVEDVQGVDLTFFAIGDEFQDAAKPALRTGADGLIPVYRFTSPDVVGTGGALLEAGAAVEGIAIPPRFSSAEGELRIEVSPSLAASTLDALDYLESFPHECIEQTVSRFLPNIVTYNALRELNIANPELERGLIRTLDSSLARMKTAQNPNGGWGWFPGMESNALVTAYALIGLSEARDAGFDVDADMLRRANEYLLSQWISVSPNTSTALLNRLPVLLYAQTRYDSTADSLINKLDSLAGLRQRLTVAAQAFLLMSYQQAEPNSPNIPTLLSALNSAALLSATGAHWEEQTRDWFNWGSDTRTTALALLALANSQPDNPLLPNAVRWLMTARQGDHWQTTQETAWSVMGLTAWMQISGELEGDYDYTVNLSGSRLLDATVTPQTVTEGRALRVDVAELARDMLNRVAISRSEGTGALYYSAFLDLRLPAEEVTALSRGVTVEREYYLGSDRSAPITDARVGDVITVRVTLTLPQDVYFFVLESPIPAGTEPIDTSLLTTGTSSLASLYADNREGRFWFYNAWAFNHVELRDQETRLYADFLSRGTYVYSYQVRATLPGEFRTLPTQGYAFYQPDVFGRTDGAIFTIAAE
jgi:uncharacterized protein YfaS (alpha-2-macroglobulin family)